MSWNLPFLFEGKKIFRDGPLENLWDWGAGEVQKKNSRKGKLNENKFLHANYSVTLKNIHAMA